MARLEAQSKLLYYPTPNEVVDLIATWFRADHKIRLADPCCGTGEALRRLADAIGNQVETRRVEIVETWGIELSNSRAAQAALVLDHVLPTSFYAMTPSKWNSASVGLLFNNPPYDWSDIIERDENGRERRIRHELLFVENATRKIVTGGHHVIIVPRGILGDEHLLSAVMRERFARHVLGWYEQVKITRFPDGEYERFKQVVVFATNKRAQYLPAGKETIEAVCCLANPETEIPILTTGSGEFDIPISPEKACFTYTPIEPAQLARAASHCSPVSSLEYQRATYVRPLGASFHPAIPLSVGHTTMLITGQETGVLDLLDDNGQRMLVKGLSRKVSRSEAVENVDLKGKVTSVSVREIERHEASLTVAHPDGRIEMLTDLNQVGKFMTLNATRLADAILEKNQPLYAYQPTAREWAITGKSGLGLPPLPGRAERGLFDVQRHFAIGAARVMRRHGAAIINAEPGWGKTGVGISTLDVMDKWPAVVMAPGHMLWKWFRDLARASDPDQPITPRVITRPVLKEPGKWPEIQARLAELGAEILSASRSQVEPVCTDDPGGRRKLVIRSATYNNPVAKYLQKHLTFRGVERDSDGNIVRKVELEPSLRYTEGNVEVTYVDRDEYTMFDFARDYQLGLLGQKAVAVIGFDAAKYDAGDQAKSAMRYNHRRIWNEAKKEWEHHRLPCCPNCGATYMGSTPRFCTATTIEKGIAEDGEVVDRRRKCGAPLFEFSRWRRTGLANLVKRKFRNFFKVYIADEVHESQSGDSDIGTADQRFIAATRHSLALTGTLFGGCSGSLFYLLYRRVPEIRRHYGFLDKKRWIDHYGLWQEEYECSPGEHGKSTGIQRWNVRIKELPGVSPSVIRYLLPITLFGNITDLGYQLPPINETVESLDLPDKLAKQMNFIETTVLRQIIRDLRQYGDAGGLSAWYSACRFRPASAFRPEILEYDGRKGASGYRYELPIVIDENEHEHTWLPKERRLAEIVRQNMALGRKTLVYVEQTGGRDIRYRLKKAIEECTPAGLLDEGGFQALRPPRVNILSADDMSPARREAWIRHNAPEMDVLIVNPVLVKTGLDLIMFSDLVFYETTTSLFTLWQAMLRVWRLGQDKDVNVTFLAYANTVEEAILKRVGDKMKAAKLLYGKEASGVLVEVEYDDIQREAIKMALGGHVLKMPSGEKIGNILTDGSERRVMVSTAPTGSLVAVSPTLVVVTQVAPQQMTLFGETVQTQGGKRKKR
jgi:hypothetical protein